MKKVSAFMKKLPLIYAALGVALLFVSLRCLKIRAGAFSTGLNEIKAALIVLLVYWLVSGRTQDLRPDLRGFSYGFRIMRYLYIVMLVLSAIASIGTVNALSKGEPDVLARIGKNLVNDLMRCLAVGVVEEFTCRAMLFGGLMRLFGKTQKGVIWAAIVSGAVFGFVHVASEVFGGQTAGALSVIQIIGKTLEAGMLGFILAVIYCKTRSVWAVAALHGLFDFISLFGTIASEQNSQSYVQTENDLARTAAIAYFILCLILIPAVRRCARELKKEPEPLCGPDRKAFSPRELTYTK